MKSHDQVFGLSVERSANGVTFVTSSNDVTRQNAPGEIAALNAREGIRVYKYMKAEEAFAAGQVSMISALLDNADVDAAASDATLTGTGDFTAKEFNDGTFPSAYVTIDATATTGQTRAILDNSANVLKLDLAWTTALTTSSDYVTYDINYVSLADTDDVSARASKVEGVAISAITDEYWAWFQIEGFCPLVRCVGTTDPAIRGALITPSSTAGACKGPTAGGTTADDVSSSFGKALHAYAAADAAGAGIAAILKC